MSGAYAGRDVEGLEDMIDERIQDFVEVIERKWLSDDNGTNAFDIAKRVQFLAVDMITHICFGKPMGFVKTDSDVSNFLKTIESQLPIVQHFSVIIEINDLLHWLVGLPFMRRLIVPSSQDKSGIGIIMGVRYEYHPNVQSAVPRGGTLTTVRSLVTRSRRDNSPRVNRRRTCSHLL